MSARPSAAVERAVASVKVGATPKAAAKQHGVSISGLRSALRRHGVPPLPQGRRKAT